MYSPSSPDFNVPLSSAFGRNSSVSPNTSLFSIISDERLSVINMASHDDLKNSRNAAYNQMILMAETYGTQCKEAQTERDMMRVKLETTENLYQQLLDRISSLSTSASTSSSLPPIKPTLTPLKREDYQDVKIWTKKNYDKQTKLRSKDTNGFETQKKKPGRKPKDQENEESAFPYIVGTNGEPVSADRLSEMSSKASRLFTLLLDSNMAPESWEKANDITHRFVHQELADEFLEFRLADTNWKAQAFLIKKYPIWARGRIDTKSRKKRRRSTISPGPMDTEDVPDGGEDSKMDVDDEPITPPVTPIFEQEPIFNAPPPPSPPPPPPTDLSPPVEPALESPPLPPPCPSAPLSLTTPMDPALETANSILALAQRVGTGMMASTSSGASVFTLKNPFNEPIKDRQLEQAAASADSIHPPPTPQSAVLDPLNAGPGIFANAETRVANAKASAAAKKAARPKAKKLCQDAVSAAESEMNLTRKLYIELKKKEGVDAIEDDFQLWYKDPENAVHRAACAADARARAKTRRKDKRAGEAAGSSGGGV